MSPAAQAWTVVGVLAAVLATVALLRGPRQDQHGGEHGQPGDGVSVRAAFRWLAAVAGLWGAAFIAQDVFGGPLGGTATRLTLADLLALLALPPLIIAVALLAGSGGAQHPSSARPGRYGRIGWAPGIGRSAVARAADGCLLVAALFAIAWVAFFARAYAQASVGAGTFALQLLTPVADLVALSIVLQYTASASRRRLAPVLALVAAFFGASLTVAAGLGAHPTAWALLAWSAALCLLGLAAFEPDRRLTTARLRPGGLGVTTIAAAGSAAVAALVLIGWSAAGGDPGEPVLVIAAAVAVLALVARVTGLLRRAGTASAISADADRQFRELADLTSDIVLVCELDGIICYASPAVAGYGYAPADLAGVALADLVHPEDRSLARRAAVAATSASREDRTAGSGPKAAEDQPNGPGSPAQHRRFSCRVRSADGTWRHVEWTVSPHRHPGAPDRLLVTARDVSDEVALRRQVTHLTFHDGLTGLPNRAYLEERAKDLLSTASAGTGGSAASGASGPSVPSGRAPAGAIFLDLDGFTAVNDSVGHGAGDLLLAQAARRLRGAVPSHDIVARWGGDEFAALVDRAASAQEIVDIAERLAGVIAAEPFRVADRDISLTASIGVALAGGSPPEHLLRNADVAMSRAKESGGGRVEVFAAHMHADVVRRLELATDLREAIAEGRLSVQYQPVVELATSRVTTVEALVRWPRGEELIAPRDFLDVAEDSGLILPLGDWVLREACHQVARWRAAGWLVDLSVNLSPRQVGAARFTQTVLAALDESGLPPDALTLEVTERVLVEGAEPMISRLAELRGLGIRLAIDDFGTGYASLAYLRQLPVDIIKIDPSFVAGLGADATLGLLTRAIVQVGDDLGLAVVAEGIERSEQLEMLRAMGCRLGQGYLVGRPMPAAASYALTGPPVAGKPSADAQPPAALPSGGQMNQAPAVL
jgi:diguanylate cyclase (GGDEF)-like protein